MEETLELIVSQLFLDMKHTYNADIIDHISVSPSFMNYLKANESDKIMCHFIDVDPGVIITTYKGIHLEIDSTLDVHYRIVYRDDSYYRKFIDIKIEPINESNLRAEWDGPKTKYDYLFMNKENNNV